ncbi:MAG: hypothetical protein LBG49_00385 [Mycoplasmataceae bacterium]|nr:hypothetical protein [Mycoplasmataceae bacterium]
MAKRIEEEKISWQERRKSIFEDIKNASVDKYIPQDAVAEAIQSAIKRAYIQYNDIRNNEDHFIDITDPECNIEVKVNVDEKDIKITQQFTVVDLSQYEKGWELEEWREISLDVAGKQYHDGDTFSREYNDADLEKLFTDKKFNTRFASSLFYFINNVSNKKIFNEWQPKIDTIELLRVESYNSKEHTARVYLYDNDSTLYGEMPFSEGIRDEKLKTDHKYWFYIKGVNETSTKKNPVIVSRADVNLVKQLIMRNENWPELKERSIEIKEIERVAGFKTKLAVVSHLPGLDAVGTIIKQSGKYIKEIEELLYNERIEVIPYDTKLEDYIVNVCAPASILGYNLVETPTEQGTIDRKITIVCEQEKMALLIGSKGKNAQLISKLLKATIEFATPAEAYESGINIVPVEAYQQRNRFANNNATAVSFEDRMAQFKKVGVNQSQRTSVNNHQPKENRKVDKKPQEDTNSSMSFADRMAQFKDISDNSDNSNKNGE